MTTTDHLQRIRARCVELLAIAEKRTQGEWFEDSPSVFSSGNTFIFTDETTPKSDAIFIASCAGPAEAGWRATIAAIDGLNEMDSETHLWRWIADAIIAAWPEELL